MTNTVTTEPFTVDSKPRTRTTRIEGNIVRRKQVPPRDGSQRALCLRHAEGCDGYPAHTEGGHLIGLSIGGVDDDRNLVPMYADFNQVRWRAFERRIYDDASVEGVRVEVDYVGVDSPMPQVFEIFLKKDGMWVQWEQVLMNDAPTPIAPTINDAAKALIDSAQKAIDGGWTAEANVPGAGGRLDPSAPRHYALLDYLYFADTDNLMKLVLALGLTWKGWTPGLGMPFTELQRELIQAVNAYKHGGYVTSDQSGTITLAGSTTHAPHVDHIVGKTQHSGPNLFSNAMVITSTENWAKGGSHFGSGAAASASSTTTGM